MSSLLRLLLAIGFIANALSALAGSLKVNLSPSQAASAGARWRVDGGAWQTSGTTVKNLGTGTHVVDYNSITGWIAPASQSATIGSNTTTITGTYVQASSLIVNLAGGIGQWRVDGGAWRAGGSTASPLAPGNHTIDYAPVAGYAAPATETASLTTGQKLTLARDYFVPASLTVNVTRYGTPSGDQWRLTGGAWQASGATLSNLRPGTYGIEFPSVAGYFPLYTSQGVTLAAGSNTRDFQYVPQCYLTVTLAPGTGSWRLNGGAWTPSGSTIGPVYPGALPLEYSAVANFTAPPSETVNLTGGSRTLARRYVGPASLTVGLQGGPGQWRIDGGAWQAGGATVSNLSAGSHAVTYAPVSGYIAPVAETVSLRVDEARNITRKYLATGTYLKVLTEPAFAAESGSAKWRIDGGAWNPAGSPVSAPAGTHTLEFQPVAGWDVPPASTINVSAGTVNTLSATFYYVHRLRFFIQQDLAAPLTTQQLRDRLSQYANHIKTIFHRESLRHFTFDPVNDISIVTASPFSDNAYGALPNAGFEVWAHARLTDQPVYGSYDGYASLDITGAGGAAGMKWDAIHDLAMLVPGSTEADEAHKQLYTLLHEFEHTFGAGLGEYYSFGNMSDPTGVAPLLPTIRLTADDPLWSARPEYWSDPLLTMVYGQTISGDPTDMATVINLTHFAPTSVGVINGNYRSWERRGDAFPALYDVRVCVVVAGTGAPVTGATVRVWNRRNPGTYGDFEEPVSATSAPNEFRFKWSPTLNDNILGSWDNAKIVKVWAPGFTDRAQWATLFDAQKTKTIDGSDMFVITVALTPAP